jgi:hypothetical protein
LALSARSGKRYEKRTGSAVGVLLHPLDDYARDRAMLSAEKREALDYLAEEIATDPDRYRLEIDGVRYEFSEDELISIAFRRTGPNDADLISFSFIDET